MALPKSAKRRHHSRPVSGPLLSRADLVMPTIKSATELPKVDSTPAHFLRRLNFGCRFHASFHLVRKTDPDVSLKDRPERAVEGVLGCLLGCVCGDAIGWVIGGTIWCLFLLVRSYRIYAGVAAISCGALILALVAWRALKADTKAFDDPNDNPTARRLINDSRERARR